MIPDGIQYAHVVKALREIEHNGVPRNRESTRYDLLYETARYPPKYAISIAARHATGSALSPADFSGGRETNDYLVALGFTVVEKHVR